MGKFDWKAGIRGASAGLREDAERRRAYERDDEQMAMQLSRQLGLPIPKNLQAKYPKTYELLLGQNLPEMLHKKQMEMEEEAYKRQSPLVIERERGLEQAKREFVQEEPLSTPFKIIQDLTGLTPKEFAKLPKEKRDEISREVSLLNQNPELTALSEYMKGQAAVTGGLQQDRLLQQIKETENTITGNRPLSAADAQKLGVPFGTKESEVKGKRVLSENDQKVLNNIKAAREVVKRAKALADNLITAEGPGSVAWQRISLGIGRAAGLNPEAQKYQDYIEANKPIIAKALKMQVGNLAVEEQEAAKAEFAQFDDWRQTKDDKYENLMRTLDANEKAIRTGEYVPPEPLSESEKKRMDEGKTAVNPKTGQRIIMKNGKWVDVQTGEPIK